MSNKGTKTTAKNIASNKQAQKCSIELNVSLSVEEEN